MDGNRRWARARGLADFEGHAAGVEAIRGLLQHAVRRGVPMLTLYAFSRENWARSDDEVSGPVRPPRPGDRATRPTSSASRASASGSWAGSRSCPDATRTSIDGALDQTAEGTRLQLNIAWNYAGRHGDRRRVPARCSRPGVAPDEVDERDDQRGALHRPACPTPTS